MELKGSYDAAGQRIVRNRPLNGTRIIIDSFEASAVPVREDPWVAIVNQRKLNDGTKELILNAIYRQPRTITQLAELLGISAPAVHRHVVDMLADELIQEVDLVAPQRSRGSERYYRPNFPVVLAADRAREHIRSDKPARSW